MQEFVVGEDIPAAASHTMEAFDEVNFGITLPDRYEGDGIVLFTEQGVRDENVQG